MRLLRVVLVTGVAVGSAVWSAPVANAACHRFMVSASSPVTEGGGVIVTVTRDAAVQDSDITVFTVDLSAHAGSDYRETDAKIEFTGSSTSKSITIPTTDDSAVESDENFSLRLKDPGGCPPNTDYEFDDTATVIIKDNDVAPTTAAPTTVRPTTTLKATSTTTTLAPTTSTASTSTSTSSTTSTTLVEDDSDDDSSAVPLLILGLALVGAAAAAVAVALRRRAASAPPEA